MQFCSLQLSFKPPHPERLLHTPFPGISLQTCSKYAIKHTNPNTAHETRLTNFSANPPANNPTDRQKGKKNKTRIPVHRCFSSKKASPRTLSLGSWESKSQAQNNCNTCSLLTFSSTSLVQLVSPPAVNLGPDAAVFNNKHDCCPLASIHFELLVAGRAVLV